MTSWPSETSDTINAKTLGFTQLTRGQGPECKEQSHGLERPQGLRASARGHGPESRTVPIGLQLPGEGPRHGVVSQGPAGMCSMTTQTPPQSAALTISSQLLGGRTGSLQTVPLLGHQLKGRFHRPMRASPAQAGPQTHWSQSTSNTYCRRVPHTMAAPTGNRRSPMLKLPEESPKVTIINS